MTTFPQKLDAAYAPSQSLLCVGLDPDPSRMPVSDIFDFNRAIIDATIGLACAYKPNLAFYEALGLKGLEALQRTVEHARRAAPHALLIGDGKRGDIDSSTTAYARAMFEVWGFDAITVNAWGGGDSLAPFFSYAGRGIFIWCRSSNPGGSDFQDIASSGEPLYQLVARKALDWNKNANIGLVIGATYPKELAQLRALAPDMPFLIPGVGAQAGDLKAAILAGVDRQGRRAIINSSRSILYASRGPDFAQAARRKAQETRDAINAVLASEGMGWS
jgi:orotidine-5'-phosphate decarboxylase